MQLIWMEAGLPRTWLMVLWPATPLTTGETLNPSCEEVFFSYFSLGWLFFTFFLYLSLSAHLTAGGAVAEKSPPFCVFIRDDAVRQTAASTANASTDAASVRKAGGVQPVTPWCVSPLPADPMASARPVRSTDSSKSSHAGSPNWAAWVRTVPADPQHSPWTLPPNFTSRRLWNFLFLLFVMTCVCVLQMVVSAMLDGEGLTAVKVITDHLFALSTKLFTPIERFLFVRQVTPCRL